MPLSQEEIERIFGDKQDREAPQSGVEVKK